MRSETRSEDSPLAPHILFDGWLSVGRTVLVGTLAYATLLVLLRVSGKRALSKMNAFDLVVTVALGSTLATIIVSPDVSLTSGIAALVTLIGMQYLLAWSSMSSNLMNRSPGQNQGCWSEMGNSSPRQ